MLILENPEAHLHPKGQRKIGELIARAAQGGVQVIVETHSDYVLNGIRLSARNGRVNSKLVKLYYFTRQKRKEGGKKIMETFLETCFEVKKIIHNESILLDRDYRSFELAKEYRIEQWRNDTSVDVENKRRLRTLLNKSVIYNSEEFEQEKESDFVTEIYEKEHTAKGCLLAYEMEGVAVSFLSSEHWKTSQIEGKYFELVENGELRQSLVNIPNVSFCENIKSFKKYYDKKREELRYTDIVSGQDILRYAPTVFPNLIFCENAVQGCRKNVGVSEAGQVYKRLLELQQAAEVMGNLPVPEEKIIYIGHIGYKLPTVKYH